MRYRRLRNLAILTICGFLFGVRPSRLQAEQPGPQAVAAFESYSRAVESRLTKQHRSADMFLAPTSAEVVRNGEPVIERVTESGAARPEGALIHHWRGTAFAPGAKAATFEHLLRDFNSYPKHFAPQVVQARVLSERGDHMRASMRVRQKHVITVVMDISYDIEFGKLDSQRGYTTSKSIQISEIDSPGTAAERALRADEAHGFLWRLNTWWSYEERDGGLYVQIESISLTRGIPRGLGWAIRPYVESVPRESLEFTLRSAVNAIRK